MITDLNLPRPIVRLQNEEEVKDPEQRRTTFDALRDLAAEHLTVEVLQVDPKQYESNECVICMDAPRNTVFYPCGHQCLCEPCGQRFKKEARHQVCPICRNRVKDIIKVYK